jgi:hypothetical protein
VIVTELHEHFSNRSLFGEDSRGRAYKAKRVREDSPSSGLSVGSSKCSYASAASSAPSGLEREVHRAIAKSSNNRELIAELKALLDKQFETDQDEVAAVDESDEDDDDRDIMQQRRSVSS